MNRGARSFIKRYQMVLLAVIMGLMALSRSLYFIYEEDFKGAIIYSDAEGYYLYLPALFIHGDFQEYEPRSPRHTMTDIKGRIWSKYPAGVAMLQAPFFLAADQLAKLTSHPRDGHSDPYVLSILVAGAFYLAVGVYLLMSLLQRYFSKVVALLSPLLLFAGTNLFFYSSLGAGLSHVYSFFLFALGVYTVERARYSWKYSDFLKIGLVFGMIVLTRLSNSILLLVPLVYGVANRRELAERILLFFKKPWAIPLVLLGIFIVFLPQMLYWKHSQGEWILNSYTGEGFKYWSNPKIWEVLFDVQNGWLLYSPLAVFALAGFPWYIVKSGISGWGFLLLLALATYIFASWWAWWFGGAFGHRCYVEYYALLAVPFAYFLQWLGRGKSWLKAVFALVCMAMIYYNYNLTSTYYYTLPWDGDNWNWERFGKVLERAFS